MSDDDAQLLRQYVEAKSEPAFGELVQRHLALVYHAAARQLGADRHLAEDITQAVFILLAEKSRSLLGHPSLAGWLHTTTHFKVARALRAVRRRQLREQAVLAMTDDGPASSADEWDRIRPVLDQVLQELNDGDREALLLRFFENRAFAEIGARLRLTEAAAHKRVERALEKLRIRLARRGVTSSAAAFAALLGTHGALAAPAGLAASVTSAVVTSGLAAVGAAEAPLGLATKLATSSAVASIGTSAGGGILALMSTTKIALTGLGLAAVVALGGYYYERQARIAAVTSVNDLARENAGLKREIAQLKTRRSSPVAAVAPSIPTSPSPVVATSTAPVPQLSDILGSQPITPTETQLARDHHKYDPFLKQAGLTPAQIDRFCYLMAEKDLAKEEVQTAIRAQGLVASPAVNHLSGEATRPYWDQMETLLGPDAWRDFSRYENSYYYQNAFLAPMLAESGWANNPLTAVQQQTLANIIAANDHPYKANPSDIGSRSKIDWETVVTQATPMLDPSQVGMLRAHAQREMSKD